MNPSKKGQKGSDPNCTFVYPMLFEPNLHTVVWGGERLVQWKNLKKEPNSKKVPNGTDAKSRGDSSLLGSSRDAKEEERRSTVPNGTDWEHVGESWEVSAVESSPSVVANGAWAGKTLPEVVASAPEEILGKAVARRNGGKMPLLVKFIDARKDLSIQVHPNDEMALREHNKLGKSEMWYILDAEPGACIYAGFKKKLQADEYKRMVEDGTITEALAKHEAHAGDVFYIPAGRVHAICSGILLAEIQQSSDVTYRIFDYNRPGLDGKPRELHTAYAAQALNYKVERKYRTDYAVRNDRANLIMESKFFSARVTEISHEFHRNLLKYDSFIITMCLKGDCVIKVRATGDEVVVKEGYSCLIPAAVSDYDIRPVDGSCKVLDAFIDNQRGGLVNKIHRLFHKNKY